MRRFERLGDLSAGIIVQVDGLVDIVIPIELVPQQTSVFKCIGQHIVPCLTFILRTHRIVRKQYQTPFQILKSHIGRVLIFPTNIETNGKIFKLSYSGAS